MLLSMVLDELLFKFCVIPSHNLSGGWELESFPW